MFKNRLLKAASEKVLLPQSPQPNTPNNKISLETATLVQSKLKERLFQTRNRAVKKPIEPSEPEPPKKVHEDEDSEEEDEKESIKHSNQPNEGFQEKFGIFQRFI